MSEAAENAAPKPRDFKKILTLAFMGFNLAVLGAGSYLTYVSTLGVKTKSLTNDQAERDLEAFEETLRAEPVIYTMEPLSTNLDGVPRRLVKVDISLEMMDAEGYEEVITIAPKARDSVMRILNGKQFHELESVQGKLQLKNQIIAAINGSLSRGVVKNVFFNDLVVQ